MFPANGAIVNGPTSFTLESVYTGITGPTNFGGGGSTRASSGSGDIVSISGAARLVDVPAFYLSGTALSDSMTFDSATFASLGATPGTHTWTWGQRGECGQLHAADWPGVGHSGTLDNGP